MKNHTGSQYSPGAAGPVLGRDINWRELAACVGEDPEFFFPETPSGVQAAKAACAACPVAANCLQFALKRDEAGIWGGTTREERRSAVRLRRSAESGRTHCKSGLHKRTPENTGAKGCCLDCRRLRAHQRHMVHYTSKTEAAAAVA